MEGILDPAAAHGWDAASKAGRTGAPQVRLILSAGATYAPRDVVRGTVVVRAGRRVRVRGMRAGLVRVDEYHLTAGILADCGAAGLDPYVSGAPPVVVDETWAESTTLLAGSVLQPGESYVHQFRWRIPHDAGSADWWRAKVHLDLVWARDIHVALPLEVVGPG